MKNIKENVTVDFGNTNRIAIYNSVNCALSRDSFEKWAEGDGVWNVAYAKIGAGWKEILVPKETPPDKSPFPHDQDVLKVLDNIQWSECF